jgi:dTDP-4-amino-4,6-dideoxygalactose transaminase
MLPAFQHGLAAKVNASHWVAVNSTTSALHPVLYKDVDITTTPLPMGFSCNSGTNSAFLTVEQPLALTREHVDPRVEPR